MTDEVVIAGKAVEPIIDTPTKLTVTNKKTGKVYSSPEEAQADVTDPKTGTKGEDIQQDCSIEVKSLPKLFAEKWL